MIFVQNNRFFYTTIGSALLIIGVLFLFSTYKKPVTVISAVDGFTDGILQNDDTTIALSIADTPTEREQGLSGTQSLSLNTGKLFIFPESGLYGFWMKDMNYAIDIVWFDDTFTIVSIDSNVLPESYPDLVLPPAPVRYVLEVRAGFSTTQGLKKGQSFTFQK